MSVCGGLAGWKPNSSVLVPLPVPVLGGVVVCVLGPVVSGPVAWVAPLDLVADACAVAVPRPCVVVVDPPDSCVDGAVCSWRRPVARVGTAAPPGGAMIETGPFAAVPVFGGVAA